MTSTILFEHKVRDPVQDRWATVAAAALAWPMFIVFFADSSFLRIAPHGNPKDNHLETYLIMCIMEILG